MRAHNEFPRNLKEEYAFELFLPQVTRAHRVSVTLKYTHIPECCVITGRFEKRSVNSKHLVQLMVSTDAIAVTLFSGIVRLPRKRMQYLAPLSTNRKPPFMGFHLLILVLLVLHQTTELIS